MSDTPLMDALYGEMPPRQPEGEPPVRVQPVVSQRRETCQWTEDENGPHATECGHAFEFTYDGVEANGFKYCCFCGGAIMLKLANDPDQRPGAKTQD